MRRVSIPLLMSQIQLAVILCQLCEFCLSCLASLWYKQASEWIIWGYKAGTCSPYFFSVPLCSWVTNPHQTHSCLWREERFWRLNQSLIDNYVISLVCVMKLYNYPLWCTRSFLVRKYVHISRGQEGRMSLFHRRRSSNTQIPSVFQCSSWSGYSSVSSVVKLLPEIFWQNSSSGGPSRVRSFSYLNAPKRWVVSESRLMKFNQYGYVGQGK